MEYKRRLFSLPTDLCDLLDKQTNKSGTVQEALRLYFKHKDTVRQVAANTGRILEVLEERTTKQQDSFGECCGGPRPNRDLETIPCPHWIRTEEGFANRITGERYEV